MLAIRQRVLGMEHAHTLESRTNLAHVLHYGYGYGYLKEFEAKQAEAEQEYRAVMAIRQRVLGTKHPYLSMSCWSVADCLRVQNKRVEGLELARRAVDGFQKTLGKNHPYTESAQHLADELSAPAKQP